MTMKRLLASVLALLLVVSLLPIGAMADTVDNNPAGKTVPEIASGDTMNKNMGTVTTNSGALNENKGTVTTNNGTLNSNQKDGVVGTNNQEITINHTGGTVGTNESKGTITENWGTVNDNSGSIKTNEANPKEGKAGVVVVNNNSIGTNKGTVETNAEGGKIETNNGTVGKKDDNGNAVAGTGNNGTIETNNGTVITNNETGTVGEKDENGNAVAGTGNNGTIETNNGTVISNNEDGTVVTNAKGGEIETNNGTVGVVDEYETTPNGYGKPIPEDGTGNFGNIDINNGSLIVNHEDATVGINNGDIELNYGDIDTNNDYVVWNYGTVETNTIDGTVWNETTQDQNGQNVTGTVTNNYGTMITNTGKVDEDGRSIYKTEYGVQVQNTDGGAGTKLLQAVENTIVKLADLFKRDGYELVGYNDITPEPEYPDEDWDGPVEYALNNNPSAQELSATEFHATRPSILSLIWKAIVKPAAPSGSSGEPEPKTVQNNIPTTLSADQVKVGAYVRQGNLLFRIIEVNDDYIRVATVPKLSEQDLADMLGFLKQHLSDAQIAKINGEPKLLEQELVTYFIGGRNEHISFYAARDLFA